MSTVKKHVIATCLTAIFTLCFQAPAFSQQPIGSMVLDSSDQPQTVGRLIGTDTVEMILGGQAIAVRFRRPGFNVIYPNMRDVTVYFENDNCTGNAYYSDQADDLWQQNDTPSVYDVPVQGIAIGRTKSTVDEHYFSAVDLYVPTLPFRSVAYKSHFSVGTYYQPMPCIKHTETGNFVALTKVSTGTFKPPFNVNLQ